MDFKSHNWPDSPYHREAINEMWDGVTDCEVNATLKEFSLLMQPVAIFDAVVFSLSSSFSMSPF